MGILAPFGSNRQGCPILNGAFFATFRVGFLFPGTYFASIITGSVVIAIAWPALTTVVPPFRSR